VNSGSYLLLTEPLPTAKRGAGVASGGNSSDNTHAPPGGDGTYWAAVVLGAAARRCKAPLPSPALIPRGPSADVAAGTRELDDAAPHRNRLVPRDEGFVGVRRRGACHGHAVVLSVQGDPVRGLIRCPDVRRGVAHGSIVEAVRRPRRSQQDLNPRPSDP
jgi:hypothetical protein